MKKSEQIKISTGFPALLLWFALASIKCAQPSQYTGFGSETTNGTIAGMVYQADGSPAQNAKIMLLPESFNPKTDSLHKAAVVDTADCIGVFVFDSIRQGAYNVLLSGGFGEEAKAFIKSVQVTPQKVSSVVATLKAAGNLMVALPNDVSIDDTVYLHGTPWLQTIDSASLALGYTVVRSLPYGQLPSVRIAGIQGDRVIIDSAFVFPGDSTFGGPFANRRVLFVSPAGNDSANGSALTPWKTIKRSVDAAGPGDIVYVHKGLYREIVVMKRSGTRDSAITFKAEKGAAVQSPDPKNCAFKFSDNSHIILDGFEISGGDCGVYNADGSDSLSQGCVIANCVIRDQTSNGIRFHARDITIAGNVISSCADYAVKIQGAAHGARSIVKNNDISNSDGGISLSLGFLTIADNRISGIRGYGVDIVDGDSIVVEANTIKNIGAVHIQINATGLVRNTMIKGNLLYNTTDFSLADSNQAALYIHNVPGLLIDNNTVANAAIGLILEDNALFAKSHGTIRNTIFYYNRAPHDFVGSAATSMTADYNCYFGPGQGAAVDNKDSGGHSMRVDPLFVDPAQYDFRLRKGSPCLGAGENGATIGALGSQ